MKWLKKLCSLAGSLFTLACCLGVPYALSMLGIVGLGFMINDYILVPLFIILSLMTAWQLHHTQYEHDQSKPVKVAFTGAITTSLSLVLMLFGVPFMLPLVGIGAILLVGGVIWDLILNKSKPRTDSC